MYTGFVVLRFRHPNMDLAWISAKLGLPCFRSWKAGSPRQTPKGDPLPGVYKDSYWVSQLEFVSKEGFCKQLSTILNILLAEKETVDKFNASGGNIEIYLQLSGAINNGDTISNKMLAIMVDLKLELSIEVFVGV